MKQMGGSSIDCLLIQKYMSKCDLKRPVFIFSSLTSPNFYLLLEYRNMDNISTKGGGLVLNIAWAG